VLDQPLRAVVEVPGHDRAHGGRIAGRKRVIRKGYQMSNITIADSGGVRTVRFARPERRNAMDLGMFRDYYEALLAADEDPGVRAIVVTAEALRIGLVQRVLPRDQVLGEAQAYAADLAEHCSPASMAAIRRQVWSGLETGIADAAADAGEQMAAALAGPDFLEAVTSQAARRAPRFAPKDARG
jgi:enoyl-CoA hydratase/carnithine racemase